MNTEAIKSIVNGTEKKGINKYMLEEVYFSSLCEDSEFDAKGNRKYNPQNAHYENGKYYFDFPDFWYNHLSNNKAIGLRRIDLYPDPLNLEFTIRIHRRIQQSSSGQSREINISIPISPSRSTLSVLEDIARKVTVHFAPSASIWDTEPANTVKLSYNFDYATSTGRLYLEKIVPITSVRMCFYGLEICNLNEDAKRFFNVKNDIPWEAPTSATDGNLGVDFPSMWNREFIFVHASFVNGTSFNYLGRSGEFYPKPSKMYKFAGGSNRFYFELSYDGRTPIKDKVADFCIDLAYIYYDKNYNAK